MINHARRYLQNLIVTSLDLYNAFGDHDFIQAVLSYHHIPRDIHNIIAELYKDYRIAVGTNNYIASRVKVKKGFLQGDYLSPLLFNMCVNTLIKCIDQEEIKLIGYSYCNTLQPRHWFQFADDTAITTAAVEELANWQNTWEKIHRLPLHPRNKLELISKHAYGKFRWRFSISCRKNG